MTIFFSTKKKKHKHVKPKPKKKPKKKPKPKPKPTPTPTPTPKPTPTPTQAPAGVPVATARERLHLNRLGTGFRQDALAKLRGQGTTEDWLAWQLSPESVPEAAKVAAVDGWFADLRLGPVQKVASNAGSGKKAWQYGLDLGNWSILRRIYSERTVLETMVEFWTSVLHIPVGHDKAWAFPVRLRRHHPSAGAGHVRGPARRLLAAPGDAALPGQLEVGQEQAQREPGP